MADTKFRPNYRPFAVNGSPQLISQPALPSAQRTPFLFLLLTPNTLPNSLQLQEPSATPFQEPTQKAHTRRATNKTNPLPRSTTHTMCQTVYFAPTSCSHTWTRVAVPCSLGMGFANCPYLLSASPFSSQQ